MNLLEVSLAGNGFVCRDRHRVPCLAQNLDREVLGKPLLADHLSLDQGPSAARTSAPSLQALSLPLPPCGASLWSLPVARSRYSVSGSTENSPGLAIMPYRNEGLPGALLCDCWELKRDSLCRMA